MSDSELSGSFKFARYVAIALRLGGGGPDVYSEPPVAAEPGDCAIDNPLARQGETHSACVGHLTMVNTQGPALASAMISTRRIKLFGRFE
jgi:hypothetical protein